MDKIVKILKEQGLKVTNVNGETLIYLETPTTTDIYKMELKEIRLK